MAFAVRTSEEQAAILDKARAARAANSAARKASTLRKDFMDAGLWDSLARERKLTLPPWGKPATVSNLRTWLHKIGIAQTRDYEQEIGCTLAAYIANNPAWPLRALAGLTLEYQQEATALAG